METSVPKLSGAPVDLFLTNAVTRETVMPRTMSRVVITTRLSHRLSFAFRSDEFSMQLTALHIFTHPRKIVQLYTHPISRIQCLIMSTLVRYFQKALWLAGRKWRFGEDSDGAAPPCPLWRRRGSRFGPN